MTTKKSQNKKNKETKTKNKLVNFNNTSIAFQSRSNLNLRKSQLLFKSFAYPQLVQFGQKMIQQALKWHVPIKPLIKATIFDHFCGGTSIEDCEKRMQELSECKVGSILDYSVEGAENEEDFDTTTKELLRVIERAGKDSKIAFAVFKVTGIARFSLLEKMSAGDSLNKEEKKEESRVFKRIEALCEASSQHGVRIMFDAEESWIQEALDQYALQMMQRFNKEKLIVYNTAQMYRVDRLVYLEHLLIQAKKEKFLVGIKLVRGAYMEKERERAQRLNYPDPIHPTKEASDHAFDQAMERLIDHIDQIGIVCGSHNEKSTRRLIQLMEERGLSPDDSRCAFSQLLGMSDHLTFNLSSHGYQASKYVPYGPVDAVLPYLFRRAEENTSIKGQAGRELQLIERELLRRKKVSG